MAVDRQDVREALAIAAAPYMTSAKVVFDQMPDSIGKNWPILAFEATGSRRVRAQFTSLQSTFYFNVYIIVLYADKKEGWTKAQADDTVDAMEHEFATFVEANPKSAGNWNNLAYGDRSIVTPPITDMGGRRYVFEQIPIAVEVYG